MLQPVVGNKKMFTVDKKNLCTVHIANISNAKHFCTGIVVELATLQNVAGNKQCEQRIKSNFCTLQIHWSLELLLFPYRKFYSQHFCTGQYHVGRICHVTICGGVQKYYKL